MLVSMQRDNNYLAAPNPSTNLLYYKYFYYESLTLIVNVDFLS